MRSISPRRKLEQELAELANPARAESSVWFFKTGKGQYGEGDRFLGVSVPAQRKVALRYRDLSFSEIARLLASRLHEHRFVALEILVARFEKGSRPERAEVFEFYLSQTARINNWDLVDTSAPYIVGEHLRDTPKQLLYDLAKSANLWERRIAIVSTLALLKYGDVGPTFAIAEMLLGDRHDLIHKAVGWALREAGKVDGDALLDFLRQRHKRLPRTTLRYAIERFPSAERKRMLSGVYGAG